MLKEGKEGYQPLSEFLAEAERLLAKSEDCLNHLHLISNDEEAIQCLRDSLLTLANITYARDVEPLSDFARCVHEVLDRSRNSMDLGQQVLLALKDCLTLMAWQLELVDPTSGQLNMDESEQSLLLDALALQLDQYPPRRISPGTPYQTPSISKRNI